MLSIRIRPSNIRPQDILAAAPLPIPFRENTRRDWIRSKGRSIDFGPLFARTKRSFFKEIMLKRERERRRKNSRIRMNIVTSRWKEISIARTGSIVSANQRGENLHRAFEDDVDVWMVIGRPNVTKLLISAYRESAIHTIFKILSARLPPI